jgi:uncharacterized protein YecE (DUF72 family)
MTEWYLGTMGFSYQDWSGPFYPSNLPPGKYLGYYSGIFNAVEVDSTFYGVPRKQVVARWHAVTPHDFQFALKIPRTVTHELGLAGVGSRDVTAEFLDVVRGLKEKLGVVLIQLPPGFHRDQFSVLGRYLAGLPDDVRFAVEFRHRSWLHPETGALLRGHGVCWAATDYRDFPREIHITCDFLYIRWIGWHGQYPSHEKEREDLTEQLEDWGGRILPVQDRLESVYGFTNNDYAGHAPATCNRFKSIVGLSTQPLTPPRQGRLF